MTRVRTTANSDHCAARPYRIEIETPRTPEGEVVTGLGSAQPEAPKRQLSDVLAGCSGGQSFRSAEEVDIYLRAERDAWDS